MRPAVVLRQPRPHAGTPITELAVLGLSSPATSLDQAGLSRAGGSRAKPRAAKGSRFHTIWALPPTPRNLLLRARDRQRDGFKAESGRSLTRVPRSRLCAAFT